MVCSLCGKQGHSVTTCTVHGAAFHRKLLKLHCAKSKQEGRRPPRLGGQTQKVIQSQQKMKYSGPKAAQRLREKKGKKELKKPGILVEDAFEACDRLQAAGFLQNPKRCPVCKGLLSDRFLFGKGERHVAVKCNSNECRRRFNVFYFSDKLPDKISRAMTPQQVLGAVTLYVQSGTKCTPSPSNAARVLGCGRKGPERLFKVFADKEAAAGRRLCNTMRLNSKVELDVTSLRVAKISTANPNFAQEVEVSKSGHVGQRVPKYFLLYIPIAGASQRGLSKLCIAKLPYVLVAPKAKPPVESKQDVQASRLFARINAGTTCYTDGNRSWKAVAKDVKKQIW